MSCINFCCCCYQCCSFCCERCNRQKKYAHVEYSTPEEANKLPPFSDIFLPVLDFTRKEGGFRLHPQPAPSTTPAKDVVTTQPTHLQYPQIPSLPSPKHVVTTPQPPLQSRHLYPPISSQTSPKRRPLFKTHPAMQQQIKAQDECPLPEDDLQLLVCDMKDEGPFTHEQLGGTADRSNSASPTRLIEQPQPLPIINLHFSLSYDIQLHTLSVHLHKVSNLPTTSSLGSVNPFFVMFLLPSKEEVLQTETFKIKTSNPCFHTMCTFHAVTMNDVHQLILVIQVFDRDRFLKDHLIGTVTMPLKKADLYGSVVTKMVIGDKDIELVKKNSLGGLLLSLQLRNKQLHGTVVKVTNLQRSHRWGFTEPYVKVYLVHQGRRHNKWKSTIKKSFQVIHFNESFQFNIADIDINAAYLEIHILSHERLSRDEVMGMVKIGPHSPQESGRSHWSEIILSPNQAASHWHALAPHDRKSPLLRSLRSQSPDLLNPHRLRSGTF